MPMETRPPEEVAAWKARDPVATTERRLLAAGAIDRDHLGSTLCVVDRDACRELLRDGRIV